MTKTVFISDVKKTLLFLLVSPFVLVGFLTHLAQLGYAAGNWMGDKVTDWMTSN